MLPPRGFGVAALAVTLLAAREWSQLAGFPVANAWIFAHSYCLPARPCCACRHGGLAAAGRTPSCSSVRHERAVLARRGTALGQVALADVHGVGDACRRMDRADRRDGWRWSNCRRGRRGSCSRPWQSCGSPTPRRIFRGARSAAGNSRRRSVPARRGKVSMARSRPSPFMRCAWCRSPARPGLPVPSTRPGLPPGLPAR